eukprot:317502-Pelagomonas_calceolata.AAC.2
MPSYLRAPTHPSCCKNQILPAQHTSVGACFCTQASAAQSHRTCACGAAWVRPHTLLAGEAIPHLRSSIGASGLVRGGQAAHAAPSGPTLELHRGARPASNRSVRT